MSDAELSVTEAEGVWVVRAHGAVIGESGSALELQAGTSEPVICFPRGDLAMSLFETTGAGPDDPVMGPVQSFRLVDPDGTMENAAWSWQDPPQVVERVRGHFAFDTSRVVVERV